MCCCLCLCLRCSVDVQHSEKCNCCTEAFKETSMTLFFFSELGIVYIGSFLKETSELFCLTTKQVFILGLHQVDDDPRGFSPCGAEIEIKGRCQPCNLA